MEESFNKLDLTGKLIIKAKFGEDIRRIPIHNDDLTYDELVLMMQRVFKGSLEPEKELLLKYKDEDGDLVTITDNSDLSYAIQYCRVLKLTIFGSSQGLRDANQPGQLTRSNLAELRKIRDEINGLIDAVADAENENQTLSGGDAGSSEENPATTNKDQNLATVLGENSREFDPLNPVDQSAGPEVDQQSVSSLSSHQEAFNTSQAGHQPTSLHPPEAGDKPGFAPGQESPAYPPTQSSALYTPGGGGHPNQSAVPAVSHPGYSPSPALFQSPVPNQPPVPSSTSQGYFNNSSQPASYPPTAASQSAFPAAAVVSQPTPPAYSSAHSNQQNDFNRSPYPGYSGAQQEQMKPNNPAGYKAYPTVQPPALPPPQIGAQPPTAAPPAGPPQPGYQGYMANGAATSQPSAPGTYPTSSYYQAGNPVAAATASPANNPYSRATTGQVYSHPPQNKPGYQ